MSWSHVWLSPLHWGPSERQAAARSLSEQLTALHGKDVHAGVTHRGWYGLKVALAWALHWQVLPNRQSLNFSSIRLSLCPSFSCAHQTQSTSSSHPWKI